jgi:inner membrane protein
MIIGHLPAGYIFARLISQRIQTYCVEPKHFVWACILGALAPDFDMLYFHLIDHRQHHHHTYFTHFPIVWVGLLLGSFFWLCVVNNKGGAMLATAFSLNGFIHMFLDSIVGDIWWFAPFIDQPFAFFTVPALYKPWWLSFIFNWSFLIEVVFVLWAGALWYRGRARKPSTLVCEDL